MEQKREMDESEIDLRELFEAIMSKWVLVLLVTFLFGILGFAYTKLMVTPQYRSTASIYVINQQNENTLTYTDLQTGLQLTEDYKVIIKGRSVMERVIYSQGLSMSYEQLASKVSVSASDESRVVNISVTDADPYRARELADAVCEAASEKIIEVTGVSKVNVMEKANIPTGPYSPNVKKTAVLGMAAGFVLSVGLILLFYMLNDSIGTPDDVQKYLGLSTLGSIPMDENVREKSRKSKKSGKKTEQKKR